MPEYTVKQGDCISSIAFKYGLSPDMIWNSPANTDLMKKRENPNALHPGDVVVIPDKKLKEESADTELRHRFRRKGVPSKFHLRLLEDNEPRKNVKYILEIDGKLISDATDEDGNLEHSIPPNAQVGRLILNPGEENEEEYQLGMGNLNPADEISGAQTRLGNLGYDCGEENGELGPMTKEALKHYQKRHHHDDTGELDKETVRQLIDEHDNAKEGPQVKNENDLSDSSREWEWCFEDDHEELAQYVEPFENEEAESDNDVLIDGEE